MKRKYKILVGTFIITSMLPSFALGDGFSQGIEREARVKEVLEDEIKLDKNNSGKNIENLPLDSENIDDGESKVFVDIKDVKFKELLNMSLGKADKNSEITVEEMLSIEEIAGDKLPLVSIPKEHEQDKQGPIFRGIKDISGIKYAKNLKKLVLSENLITDIRELEGLKELEHIDILRNRVEDLSPLSNLSNLKYLNIYNNEVKSLDPLLNLDKMEFLDCHFNSQEGGIDNIMGLRNKPNMIYCNIESNFIEDISPLKDMEKLRNVGVGGNRIKDLSPVEGLVKDWFLTGKFENGAGEEIDSLYLGINFQKDFKNHSYKISGNSLEIPLEIKGLDSFVEYGRETYGVDLPIVENLPEEVVGKIVNNKLVLTFPELETERREYNLSGITLQYSVYALTFEDFKVEQVEKEVEDPGQPILIGGVLDKEKDVPDEIEANISNEEDKKAKEEKYIDYLYSRGIIKGYQNEKIGAEKNLTRAEAIAILSRVFNFERGSLDIKFKDEKNKTWYSKDLENLSSLGIVKGSRGEFKGGDDISYEEFITLLIRCIERAREDSLNRVGSGSTNSSSWAKESIEKAIGYGLVDLDGKDNFKDEITRGEIFLIIGEYMEINKKK